MHKQIILKIIKVVSLLNKKTTLKFESSDVQVALNSDGHINKLPFTATFMLIDSPSDGTPCGADAPVILSMDEAKKSIDTMNLMAIDCEWDDWCPEWCMTGHDPRNKIGVVESAYIDGNEMKMKGIVYANDFPDIAFFIKNATQALGFSMECIADTKMGDDGFEHLENVTFTGVAILFANLAAFEDTYIEQIAAAKKKQKEEVNLTNEEITKLMDGFKAVLAENQKHTDEQLKTMDERMKQLEASKPKKQNGSKSDEFQKQLEAAQEALKEANEKAEQQKLEFEKKLADAEALRKTLENKQGEHKELSAKEIWKDGFKEGLPLMLSKMKDKITQEGHE